MPIAIQIIWLYEDEAYYQRQVSHDQLLSWWRYVG